jgi:Na+-driven multidrug efflux pump
LNIALSCFFVFGLGWGAASIALATSLSAWANVVILAFGLSGLRADCKEGLNFDTETRRHGDV